MTPKRGGPRKGFGGPQPNAGRKPDPVKTKPVQVWLTPEQHAEFKLQGQSGWLQGQMNLKIKERLAREALAAVPDPEQTKGEENGRA